MYFMTKYCLLSKFQTVLAIMKSSLNMMYFHPNKISKDLDEFHLKSTKNLNHSFKSTSNISNKNATY